MGLILILPYGYPYSARAGHGQFQVEEPSYVY